MDFKKFDRLYKAKRPKGISGNGETLDVNYPSRVIVEDKQFKKRIENDNDVALAFKSVFPDDLINTQEQLAYLFADENGEILGIHIHQLGSRHSVGDDQMILARILLDLKPKYVFSCHNHPTGILDASDGDKGVDRIQIPFFKKFGCTLVDNFILTERGFTTHGGDPSMAE